ncbi:hypothetical protein [uncultured Cetobacterium sp.]|uniref:hypothetical protein n=1 Tax=uncultured Cetobacterium sp. TaxID=527638 RepID=UPI002623DC2E|nr:hypothetical protein [uncultured Cetobacterium sp.]
MKLLNFIDFNYVIEHNNEYFEFEFEDDFLDSISEKLDVENFEIIAMDEVKEGIYLVTVKVDDTTQSFDYKLSDSRIKYINSLVD